MSFSSGNSYEEILDRCLAHNGLSDLDKRQGSVIYDALAPLCLELAEAYIKMDIMESENNVLTATGDNLDNVAYNYGLARGEATKAQRIGSFKKYQTDSNGSYVLDSNGKKILIDMEIPYNSRFTVPDNPNLVYDYQGMIDGNRILVCESAGSGGNDYLGMVLPLTPIQDLAKAEITGTLVYGENAETDEEFRKRIRNYITNIAFGGNIQDYRDKVLSMEGTGAVKVFPAWNGGGTVLLSIVSSDFTPMTTEALARIKNVLDPDESTGQGYGLAPIGHFVTVTTPTEVTLDVSVSATIAGSENIGSSSTVTNAASKQIKSVVTAYIKEVRSNFGQYEDGSFDYKILAVYRSRIVQEVLANVKSVTNMNLNEVSLNGDSNDISYTDVAEVGKQYLPKLRNVYVNGILVE